MSALNFVDRYVSTLASGYTSGGTTISVSVAPSGVSGTCNFYVIVQAEGANTEEVFQVTNISGTTLTVVGAQAGTSASDHGAGAVIIGSIMTAGAFDAFRSDISKVGPFASLPASGMKSGDQYICTDAPYRFVFDGSNWIAFCSAGGPAISLPPTTGWTTENIGGGSFTDSGIGIQTLLALKKGAVQASTAYRTAPGTPYTLTICFTNSLMNPTAGTDTYQDVYPGVGFRSASAQWEVFANGSPGTNSATPGGFLNADKWTSPTSFSATRQQYGAGMNCYEMIGVQYKWVRITDSGSNLAYYFSKDGFIWTQLITAFSRTNFLSGGPTGVGLFGYSNGCGMTMNLIGWTVT